MPSPITKRKAASWPTREVLLGLGLLTLAGCGEAGAYLVGSAVGAAATDDSQGSPQHNQRRDSDLIGDPREVRVTGARLRGTPGGCEVDVTFSNVTRKPLDAGFEVDILDATSHRVASRSTAVQEAGAGETKTVSSEGTTAGPSGVRCPSNGQARVTNVFVGHF